MLSIIIPVTTMMFILYIIFDESYRHKSEIESQFISENTGKFLLRDLATLTNSIFSNSQHGALMNRLSVMMTPIGWREFPTMF